MNKCVYTHELDGKVVYIGSGSKNRVTNKNNRSQSHLFVWDNLKFKVIKENLSIEEAVKLEQELINMYWETGELFNKNKTVNAVKTLNFKELSEIFYYDETSPTYLRWKVNMGKKMKAQDVAGHTDISGYSRVILKHKSYRVHRIIVVLNTKQDIPNGMVVDHIDGNKSNNSIGNLRIVTQSDNTRNKVHAGSNTGYQCIYENKNYELFCVEFATSSKIKTNFSYKNTSQRPAINHYQTRDLALQAALDYRNSLVKQGKIILTGK